MKAQSLVESLAYDRPWPRCILASRPCTITPFCTSGSGTKSEEKLMPQACVTSESAEGRWATGPAPDGGGQFEYVQSPQAMGLVMTELPAVDPRVYGTPKQPTQPASS